MSASKVRTYLVQFPIPRIPTCRISFLNSPTLEKEMCRKYHFVDAFWCFVCAMKNEPKKDTYVTMNGRPNEWDGLVRLIITHTNFSREELLTCQDAVVVREKKVS